jgi:hypothetical protein
MDLPPPQVTIRLELPDRVPANVPVAGRLVVTNAGKKTLSLVTPLYNGALNLVVFDKYWNMVTPDAQEKAHVAYDRVEVPPGQSVTFELNDLAYTSGTARMAFKLKQGVYYVVAVYHPGTERLPDQSAYPFAVASNVLELTVQ